LLAALDRIEEVIALIRASASAEEARTGLMGLLAVDEIQATEILNMQLRRLAALERNQLTEQYDGLMRDIAGYEEVLASPARQRGLIAEELTGIVDRFGDERRTRIVPAADEMSMEDLIPAEPVVVTLTRGGYAKRTRLDLYRTQRRGGKGVRGAALRGDDVVEHFFVTSTHHWVLFFTDKGRVYRAKAYELPEGGRDARGQHVANLLALAADERIAAVLTLKDYNVAPYLVLATRHGFVKKTRLTEYDSPRAGGIIAISLRHPDDRVIGAKLVAPEDDVLLVSRKGQALRFRVDDSALRPMGRATSGVTGMRFRPGDELLTLARIPADVTEEMALVTVTDAGYAKRTTIDAYRRQGRGGFGVRAARLSDERGGLVGSLVAVPGDEMLLIMASGKVVRTSVRDVPAKGRDTMGVIVAKPDRGDAIVAVTRNPEPVAEEDVTHLTVTDAADDAGQVTASGAGAPGGVVAPADLAPEDLAPEDVAPEDVAPEDVAPEDLAPEDVAPDDGTADEGGEQGSDSS
jgi:DNA gyrase subunit A